MIITELFRYGANVEIAERLMENANAMEHNYEWDWDEVVSKNIREPRIQDNWEQLQLQQLYNQLAEG